MSPPASALLKLQRVQGEGWVVANAADGQTRLADLRQEGAACIRLPKARKDPLTAVLINTGGGLTGGDCLTWRIEAQAGADLCVTTQACEKVYRSDDGEAEVSTQIVVGEQARLAWLPQETILFDGARIRRRIEADIAASASFLAVEAVLLGRAAMGETMRTGLLCDRWRVRRGGRLVFADDVRLEGDIAALTQRPAILAGAGAFATVLLIAPEVARYAETARAIIGEAGGLSAFDNKLIVRLTCGGGAELRVILSMLLPALNAMRKIPRVWTV